MCFKDSANMKSNQKYGYDSPSNLCAEIMEVTDAKTTAICTLQVFHFKSLLKIMNMII
jgi:hypothetical protein